MRFVMRELLQATQSQKHNPLLNFSVRAKVDQIANMNLPAVCVQYNVLSYSLG